MKTAFLETIVPILRIDKKTIIVTADMGFSVFEDVQKEFKQQFINTGVTEQASAGIACGLALSGYTVFLYAQAAFATMRCFEQVRLDIAYNAVDVKIIGTAAGLSLNQLGVSHFAIEDVALMRQLPGMTVYTPGDPIETAWAIEKAYQTKGPAYIRLTKNGSAAFHSKPLRLQIGKGVVIRNGADVTLFVSGGLLYLAEEVRVYLATKNVAVSIVSMPTVKPLDTHLILHEAKIKKAIFTLEEHSIIGGLGTAVAEILAQHSIAIPFYRFGIPDQFIHTTGTLPYLLSAVGLDRRKMTAKILSMVRPSQS